MRHLLLVVILAFYTSNIHAQVVNIPDANFLSALINQGVDLNGDGQIQQNEANMVKQIDVDNLGISDLTGIRSFKNLNNLFTSSNELSSLNVAGMDSLKILQANWNDLINLNIDSLDALVELSVYFNKLTEINVSHLTNLEYLSCRNNRLTSLIAANLPRLLNIQARENQIDHIDLSNCLNLEFLNLYSNKVTQLNLTGFSKLLRLELRTNQLTLLNLDDLISLQYLECQGNQLTNLNLEHNTALQEINCSGNFLETLDLSGLSPRFVSCEGNLITNLTLSDPGNLLSLGVADNLLTELDLTGYSSLTGLSCSDNQLSILDLSDQSNLGTLGCAHNDLQTLDLRHINQLSYISCHHNQLNQLHLPVDNTVPTEHILAHNNLLDSLYLDGLNSIITSFRVDSNLFVNLDFSSLQSFYSTVGFDINCESNQLRTLNIKEGKNTSIRFNYNPDLEHVCIDQIPKEVFRINKQLDEYNYDHVVLNSYCSHVPGGTYYEIQGIVKSCDSPFYSVPFTGFEITAFNDTFTSFSNAEGAYYLALQEGQYEIQPFLDNGYYIFNPEAVVVAFPGDSSPFNPNFCAEAIAPFNDLLVTAFPVSSARPGFGSTYKIIYQNDGTTILSGSLDFTFDHDIMTFENAMPNENSNNSGKLTWDFVDLLPFERREILLTFLLNSPMDTPPLNDGDQLNFSTTIYPLSDDEMPENNMFEFEQTLVNSFDPNNKTCLQGDQLHTDLLGDYVHYMIRFENLGSANAEHVVVKDIIDTDRFDIATLTPVSGSHEYKTKIYEQNKVEFLFEGINLPFDDEENDGYVVFKIKAWSTLFVGDTLVNEAEIFFDYNFPILTEPANTIIVEESYIKTQKVDELDVEIFPNPAHSILNIRSDQLIDRVQLSHIDGRRLETIVFEASNQQLEVDVKLLSPGSYILKIWSAQRHSTKKLNIFNTH